MKGGMAMSVEFTPEQEKVVKERAWDEADKAVGWVVNLLKKRFGEEVYQVLVDSYCEGNRERFRKYAEEAGDVSIESFLKYQWEPLSEMGFEYTMEKTEEGFQVYCTKCPPAEQAIRNGTTELNFHMCCGGDQFNVEGFNSNIGFTRTKTLMQGDDCCDHFYFYKDKK
jgi:hypothetical protein